MDTRRLKAAVEHYQARLGRALTDKEMRHIEKSIAEMYPSTEEEKNMADDRVTNLVNFTKTLEDKDRERQGQRRREEVEENRNRTVRNLAGLAGGRSRSENNNGGIR